MTQTVELPISLRTNPILNLPTPMAAVSLYLLSQHMKSLVLLTAFLISSTCAFGQFMGRIESVTPTSKSFLVSARGGEQRSFRTKVTTAFTLNGKAADFDGLSKGMIVQVSPGEADFAARVVSPPPGKYSIAVPSESTVVFQANTLKDNPCVVGFVKAGQTITIIPKKVSWTRGGSKRGKYCDWQGYPGETDGGYPSMALVAEIGDSVFLPKDNKLSFDVSKDGILMLYANDAKGGDNQGRAEVVVRSAAK